jgi:elongation factor P
LSYIDVVVAASELRDGMIIRFNGTPCRVLVLRNCGGVILARLKNLLTGESLRQRFRAEAKLDEVLAEREMMSYLFDDADHYWFMNTRTFDQIPLSKGLIGKRRPFLRQGMTLEVAFVDSSAVWVAFKKAIDARIAFTFPPDHYQSAYKRARLDNGVEVLAPLFIEAGDTVTVDLDLLQVIRPLSRADR